MPELRELRTEDAVAVAALMQATYGDARPVDAGEILSWLANSVLDSAAHARVLVSGDALVGYVDLFLRGFCALLDVAAPGHEQNAVEGGESRGRELGATSVRLQFPAGHARLAELATHRGYVRVRKAFLDAWDHHPQPIEHWREFELARRGFDPSLGFVAPENDAVAGILLAYSERAGDSPLGWIGILGVRRRWRRQTLGEPLLRHAFRELHSRGLRRIGLGVDAESPTGATRLYERSGCTARPLRRVGRVLRVSTRVRGA